MKYLKKRTAPVRRLTQYSNGFRVKRTYAGKNSKSITVTNIVARSNNNQGAAGRVQQILNAHLPGATTAWKTCAWEVLNGNDLIGKFSTAYTMGQGTKFTGITISSYGNPDSTLVVAYRRTATEPFRLITGLGKVRGYFKFDISDTNYTIFPEEIVLIGESDASFKLKIYYKELALKSLV